MSSKLQFAIVFVSLIALFVFAAGCATAPAPTTAPAQAPAQALTPTKAAEATKAPAATVPPTQAAAPAVTGPAVDAQAAVKGLSLADRTVKLYDNAKKEGALQMYTSMNIDNAQAIIDEFKKKYPGIDAKVFRAGPADLYTKLVNEARAGSNLWDIMDIDPEYVYTLDNDGLLAPWDSPVRSEIPEALRDPKGIWVSLYLNINVLTWNTNLVKAADAPKKYEDLLDPKWKGKFSLDTADYPWAYYILKTMGQDKGKDFLTKLAANKPVMITGRTNQTNSLISGDISVSTALYDYQEISQKKKGAPIDFTYVEPVRVENEPIMLNKKAAHPYAALLFLDWMLSKEGQTTMVALTNRVPVRLDVPLQNESQAAVLKGKYVLVPLDEAGKSLKDIQPLFAATFGLK